MGVLGFRVFLRKSTGVFFRQALVRFQLETSRPMGAVGRLWEPEAPTVWASPCPRLGDSGARSWGTVLGVISSHVYSHCPSPNHQIHL